MKFEMRATVAWTGTVPIAICDTRLLFRACLSSSNLLTVFCSTGCTWRLSARLVLHGARRWAISVLGTHGKRRVALVYKSRNPLIKLFLSQHQAVLKDIGQSPSYLGAVEKPPVGISTAELARCYVTAAQASRLMRNMRYQQRRTKLPRGTQAGLIVDRQTTLSDAFMAAARAPGGKST